MRSGFKKLDKQRTLGTIYIPHPTDPDEPVKPTRYRTGSMVSQSRAIHSQRTRFWMLYPGIRVVGLFLALAAQSKYAFGWCRCVFIPDEGGLTLLFAVLETPHTEEALRAERPPRMVDATPIQQPSASYILWP
uniref:Uncharacterized protein n=1 Tax=Coccidioides posadasii RMSCC 3488 TaxID=454284 RepID=A0A0J6FAL3_COCPO|nr:hypothetical protein CPAG_02620 [Coccidioides posadasii RMSCC 3488]